MVLIQIVVFDAYAKMPSTKFLIFAPLLTFINKRHSPIRRSKGKVGKMVMFSNVMTLGMKKKMFPGKTTKQAKVYQYFSQKMVSKPYRQRVMQACFSDL